MDSIHIDIDSLNIHHHYWWDGSKGQLLQLVEQFLLANNVTNSDELEISIRMIKELG